MRARWLVVAGAIAVAALIALWALTSAGTSSGEAATASGTRAGAQPAESLSGSSPRALERPREEDGASAATLSPAPARAVDGGSAGEAATEPPPSDGGLDAVATTRRWLEQNAAAAEKNVDAFCDEAKHLNRDPPGPADGHDRDASSFLTVRVDWEDNVRPPGLLHLPEALRQRLKAYGDGWPQAITDADLVGLDFSWMSALHQFDHWNLFAEGPLHELTLTDPYTAPIPNFVELQSWTKLRLARAMRTGDFQQASADIHQLVLLLRTTGTLIADMVGIILLNLERVGLAATAGAPADLAYPADDTLALRHVGRSAMYFFYPGVSEQVMKKAAACNPHFACSALAEGLIAHVTMAEVLPADTRSTVQGMIDATRCNPELMQRIASAPPKPAEALVKQLDSPGVLERSLFSPAPAPKR